MIVIAMWLCLAVGGAAALPHGARPHALVVLGESNSSLASHADEFVHAERFSSTRGSAFWSSVCELATDKPRSTHVTASENLCGCIESENDLDPGFGLPEWGHYGCKKGGPNPVSAVFDKYPWCFMNNSQACPLRIWLATMGHIVRQQTCSTACPRCGSAVPAPQDPNRHGLQPTAL